MRVSFLLTPFFLSVLTCAGEPELEFRPARVDFGRQPQNQALVAQVKLTNPTAALIVIRRVESDCACTTGQVFPLRLPPGASADLTVRVQTGAIEGSFRHSLFVMTNRDRQTLPVSAEVYRYLDWAIAPSRLIFAPSPHGAEAVMPVRLDYRGAGKPEIVSALSDSPWIEVGRPRIEGKTVVFPVRKLPAAPSGSVFADLRIATRDAAAPVLTIPVFAYVTSPVAAHPNPVIMPVVAAGAAARTMVEITGWDGARPLRARLSGGQADLPSPGRIALTLIAAKPGISTHQLEIYDGSDLILTVPVVQRTEP